MWRIDGRRGDRVPVSDRGLHYGDGLFETMAVIDGRIRHLQLHLRRLREGARRLGLGQGAWRGLPAELSDCVRGHERAVLKLIVTRGDGQRGYAPPATTRPRRLVSLGEWPRWPASYATRGVAVRVCRTRVGLNPGLAGIKHLNRLEQVLARGEWRTRQWQEGLMLDCRHRVICGTMSNVFAVHGQQLVTPDLSDAGVAGVMRAVIRREAPRLQLAVEVAELTLDRLAAADEIFLSNALIGVWPVRRLGERRLPEGPITRALIEALRDRGHLQ